LAALTWPGPGSTTPAIEIDRALCGPAKRCTAARRLAQKRSQSCAGVGSACSSSTAPAAPSRAMRSWEPPISASSSWRGAAALASAGVVLEVTSVMVRQRAARNW